MLERYDRSISVNPAFLVNMEFKVLTLALLCSTVCVYGGLISPRITNGTGMNDTNIEEFKNLAILIQDGQLFFCTGYLISEKAILTAAHCFDTYPVLTGANISSLDGKWEPFPGFQPNIIHGGQPNFIVNLHPEYNQDTKANDVAVISLVYPMRYRPIVNLTTSLVDESATCTVSGMGINEEGVNSVSPAFQEVDVTECQNETEGHICATAQIDDGAHGVLCKYDAGSPLVCDNELVGIAVSDTSCGKGGPDVYQSINDLKEWIEDQIVSAATVQPEITSQVPGSTPESEVTSGEPGSTSESEVTSQESGSTAESGVTSQEPGSTSESEVTSGEPEATQPGSSEKPSSTPGSATTLVLNPFALLTTLAIVFNIIGFQIVS